MAKLTGPACRAGRALLKWSMRDLVEASGVSLPTILKLENDGAVTADTAFKISRAFERYGVEITNGDGTGARLREAE
jgi:transcriptional regulator with XRE-family HTH domain